MDFFENKANSVYSAELEAGARVSLAKSRSDLGPSLTKCGIMRYLSYHKEIFWAKVFSTQVELLTS